MELRVNEIFYSLHGEGYRSGEPSVFIRLSGCDLACKYCDTEFESGQELTVIELLSKVKKYPSEWVTWTGGEPMLQLTGECVKAFRDEGYKQSIETSGTHKVPFDVDWLVVSPKVAEHVLHRNFPNGVDELRYPWHSGKISTPEPAVKSKIKYLSPIDGTRENMRHCIKLCLDNSQWRLSTQMHKYWGIL